MPDGETLEEESMESDILSPGMTPSFQNFLLQFLDTKAPVLGNTVYKCW